MASVKLGPAIADIRGSIGGTVFSRNKGGAYIKSRVVPVNPNSPRQDIVRSAMAFLTDYWANTLTAANRTAWGLYASSVTVLNRLGEAINLSGFNHFIRSNMIRKQMGIALVNAGPTVFEIPAQDPTFAITASEATQLISYSFDTAMDWANEDGGWLVFFDGSPQNPQINFFNGPWRLNVAAAGAGAGPPVSPATPPVVFVVAEGQHLWSYARILRADGRMSEPFRDDTFCAA